MNDLSSLSAHLSSTLFTAPAQSKRDYSGLLNLKSNELFHPLLDTLIEQFLGSCSVESVRSYPYFPAATRALAEQLELGSDMVLLTAGSDAGIQMIIQALASTTGRIVLMNPAYANYRNYAQGAEVRIHSCDFSAGTFSVAVDQLMDTLSQIAPATVVVTNPNGFDGELIPMPTMLQLAQHTANWGHVLIVDEAYVAFSNIDHRILASRFEHVVLVGSHSKSYGAAGLRLGRVIASPEMIDYLSRWKPSNPVSALSLDYLDYCLAHHEQFESVWSDIVAHRQRLETELRGARPSWRIPTSHTNFVLVDLRDTRLASKAASSLEQQGILVRSFPQLPSWRSCLRITVSPAASERVRRLLLEPASVHATEKVCD